jgi:hypothetical protein
MRRPYGSGEGNGRPAVDPGATVDAESEPAGRDNSTRAAVADDLSCLRVL